MSKSVYTNRQLFGALGELSCGCEVIDIATLSEPDPRWEFTDTAGHTHRWHFRKPNSEIGSTEDTWALSPTGPTCRVVEVTYYDEYGDGYPVFHRECLECGETIHFGLRSPVGKRLAPGMRSWEGWYLSNEPMGKAGEMVPLPAYFVGWQGQVLITRTEQVGKGAWRNAFVGQGELKHEEGPNDC